MPRLRPKRESDFKWTHYPILEQVDTRTSLNGTPTETRRMEIRSHILRCRHDEGEHWSNLSREKLATASHQRRTNALKTLETF